MSSAGGTSEISRKTRFKMGSAGGTVEISRKILVKMSSGGGTSEISGKTRVKMSSEVRTSEISGKTRVKTGSENRTGEISRKTRVKIGSEEPNERNKQENNSNKTGCKVELTFLRQFDIQNDLFQRFFYELCATWINVVPEHFSNYRTAPEPRAVVGSQLRYVSHDSKYD
jgi:hypothetical protein